MFQGLIGKLRKNPRRLVFTEGHDARILEAAARLAEEGLLTPVLVGNRETVIRTAREGGFDISGAEIADPETFTDREAMARTMAGLRNGKMTVGECREALKKGNYFGTMLVRTGRADCLLGGATYSTADTVRPALQLIRTRPGSTLVTSSFVLIRGDEKIVMGDCAVNVAYEDMRDADGVVRRTAAERLAESAAAIGASARGFGLEPRVAMLSFSTRGSARAPQVDLVRKATDIVRKLHPEILVDGELQFDAAVSPEVAGRKCPDSPLAGSANTFVFPEIQSANIGYKIAQRLGGFAAFGPVLLGLNAPVNDLSRGCSAEEVYHMAIITAASV